MTPVDAAAPAANVLLAEVGAFALTVLAGVIVSLLALWLASRQRAKQEEQAQARRREVVLAAIGRELRWNRVATRGGLDASNVHVKVWTLATVAFERHAGELATIAPKSLGKVYEHYSLVRTVQEGIRTLGPLEINSGEQSSQNWIDLSSMASVAVSNSATDALKSLGLPIED